MIPPYRALGTYNRYGEQDEFFIIKIINSFINPLPPPLVIRY